MKAQGLPLNTIVLGALAVLVLVILAAVFIPGVGNMFRSIFGLAPDSYTTCTTYCNALSAKHATSANLLAAFQASSFCDDYDWNGDGTVTVGENCVGVVTECTATITDGTPYTMSTC